jgi:hypothetical protein
MARIVVMRLWAEKGGCSLCIFYRRMEDLAIIKPGCPAFET